MTKSERMRERWSLAEGSASLLMVSALVACQGKVVEVGDVETESTELGGEATTSETTGEETCDGAEARVAYDAWLQEDNDLGALAGSSFEGYVEGGEDLKLVIDEDGSAILQVGEVVEHPLDKNKGYLCGALEGPGVTAVQESKYGACQSDLVAGASYVIHGARLHNERVRIPLQSNSPYDAWCALQVPVVADDSDTCRFGLTGLAEGAWGPEECSLADEVVDCGWLLTTGWTGGQVPCDCTSTECFAWIYDPADFEIDARWDDEAREIVGSLLKDERSTPVHLFKVPE